jgi:hypothetical protein
MKNFNFSFVLRFWNIENKYGKNYLWETFNEKVLMHQFQFPAIESTDTYYPVETIEIDALVHILLENELKQFISNEPVCYELFGEGHLTYRRNLSYEADNEYDEEIYIDKVRFQKINSLIIEDFLIKESK